MNELKNQKPIALMLFVLANILFVLFFYALARFLVYIEDINFLLKYFDIGLMKVRTMQMLWFISLVVAVGAEIYIVKIIFYVLNTLPKKTEEKPRSVKFSPILLWILCAIVIIMCGGLIMKAGEYSQELISGYKETRDGFFTAYGMLLIWLYSMPLGFGIFLYVSDLYRRSK